MSRAVLDSGPGASLPISAQKPAQIARQKAAALKAIATQANAKRNAANTAGIAAGKTAPYYGGGPITGTPAQQASFSSAPIANPQYAALSAPKAPVTRNTGAGRTVVSSDDGGGGGLAPAPAMFVPPESVTAAPAAVMPPAVVAEAAPSEINVPGESFTAMGTPGTFGQFERRRSVRGPRTGLSVTPEMIRRAAASRLG